MSATFTPIPSRPAPSSAFRLWRWVKSNLFNSWIDTSITLIILLTMAFWLPKSFDWIWVHAIFERNSDLCQNARGAGACWGVVAEKYRVILFGRYPFDEQWRPLLATGLMLGVLIISCIRYFWRQSLLLIWVIVLLAYFGLMSGSIFGFPIGLSMVTTDQWGGLPLTIMLSTLSIILAFPLAVLVALGRRSKMPAIRSLCITYVELVRGVPLISVLFMASFMFPLLMPQGTTPDVLLRVVAGITLFAAAYLAEIVRGGLQAIPSGQYEAAATLGLSYWQTQFKVILPQALAHVIPGIMNNFIAIFKDTSLVSVVSLYELSGSMKMAVEGDANWRPFKIEAYLFITLIYFIFCFAMSRYSLWVEHRLARSHAR